MLDPDPLLMSRKLQASLQIQKRVRGLIKRRALAKQRQMDEAENRMNNLFSSSQAGALEPTGGTLALSPQEVSNMNQLGTLGAVLLSEIRLLRLHVDRRFDAGDARVAKVEDMVAKLGAVLS